MKRIAISEKSGPIPSAIHPENHESGCAVGEGFSGNWGDSAECWSPGPFSVSEAASRWRPCPLIPSSRKSRTAIISPQRGGSSFVTLRRRDRPGKLKNGCSFFRKRPLTASLVFCRLRRYYRPPRKNQPSRYAVKIEWEIPMYLHSPTSALRASHRLAAA